MLSEFYNEVLFFGPLAVLPQNLNSKWIERLQNMADDFFDSNFNLNECKDPRDIGDPVLAACVYEILRYQYGDKFDFTPKEILCQFRDPRRAHRVTDGPAVPPFFDSTVQAAFGFQETPGQKVHQFPHAPQKGV